MKVVFIALLLVASASCYFAPNPFYIPENCPFDDEYSCYFYNPKRHNIAIIPGPNGDRLIDVDAAFGHMKYPSRRRPLSDFEIAV
ncbi:hypothetical protein QR680_014524 [Steinernema hermaphroditum]|uniref:Uncharacterized protein n=1 Tax=Steinernema hermaphroditum TaxID=289476 RepID=A0AA39IAS6_9BILA|nr:hypothetical protein QR680_014524 [Steinernema hermaphroditum]